MLIIRHAVLLLEICMVDVLPQCAAPGDEQSVGDVGSLRDHLTSSCSWQFISIRNHLLLHLFITSLRSFIVSHWTTRIGITHSDQMGSRNYVNGEAQRTRGDLLGRPYQ